MLGGKYCRMRWIIRILSISKDGRSGCATYDAVRAYVPRRMRFLTSGPNPAFRECAYIFDVLDRSEPVGGLMRVPISYSCSVVACKTEETPHRIVSHHISPCYCSLRRLRVRNNNSTRTSYLVD